MSEAFNAVSLILFIFLFQVWRSNDMLNTLLKFMFFTMSMWATVMVLKDAGLIIKVTP